jgi:hypothetical protein
LCLGAHSDRFKESDFGIPEETLKAHVQALHLSLELARKLIVQVLYSNEPLFTIFSVLALLLVAIVGKIFGGLTLLYLGSFLQCGYLFGHCFLTFFLL